MKPRLGAIPTAVDERLRVCTPINPALDAATWDEFAAYLPALATNEA